MRPRMRRKNRSSQSSPSRSRSPAAAASAGASPAVASRSAPTSRAKASARVRRSTAAREVVIPWLVTRGDRTARRKAVVSSMRSSRVATGRYHSSMVNSAAWGALPSPFRPDARELEDGARPRHQQALHREFGAGVETQGMAHAVRADALGGEGGEMHLLPRRSHRIGRLDLGIAARGEEGAGGGGQEIAPAEEG